MSGGNVYDALLAEQDRASPPDATGEYDQLLQEDELDRSIRIRRHMVDAESADPAVVARSMQLSAEAGVPYDVVERNRSVVQARVDADRYDSLLNGSPAIGRWIAADPLNAKIARDDYERLSGIEKSWNELRRFGYGLTQGGAALYGATLAKRLEDIKKVEEKAASGEALSPYERGILGNAAEYRRRASEALARQIGKVAEAERQLAEIPMRPALREMNEAQTFANAWQAFLKDPAGIILDLTLQSLPSLVAGVGGTLLGGPGGGIAATGLSSAAQEFVTGIVDNLQDLGVKTDDPKALEAAVRNRELMAEVRRRAAIKAAIVGTFDAATMGVAGLTLAPRKIAGRMLAPVVRQALNVPAQFAVQAAGGAGGEFLGSWASGQEIRPGAVLAEVVGEFPGFLADTAAMRASRHGPHRAAELSDERRAAAAAIARIDAFNKLGDRVAAMTMAQLSPEKTEEAVRALVEPGGPREVFMPAAKM
ncbi:MAG: hypothetical protein KIT36_23575, partial [Alphaproteobacteria bacterium]|nr:hypothetical protein [Alphaproteobacteria bacterium]